MTFSSSIKHKLRSNDPLTDEEAAVVRNALAGSLNRLHTLQNEVNQLQHKFDSLSLEKQGLNAFVEGHRRFLSPARRLLPEILQEIFYHCLPTAHNAVMYAREAPLLLGQVCSQWRQIACSTPKLWSSIHIVVTPPLLSYRSSDIARQEAISAWLSRSGALPLSISMSTSGFGFSRHPRALINDQVQPFLDRITPFAQRWKSIHFTLRWFEWTDFFTQFSASDLPLLESLHIEGYRRRRDMSEFDFSSLSREDGVLQAPRLRNLSLSSYLHRLLELRVRWKNLTCLDLGSRSIPLDDVAKALAMCPNLEVCTISIISPGHYSPIGSLPQRMEHLTLSKLRSLSVIHRSTCSDNTVMLFENISAPALRHLSYERTAHVWPDSPSTRGSEDRLTDSLRLFLRKLVHPLEELDLWINPFSGKHVVDILPLVPELKRLSLKGYGIPPPDLLDTPPSPSLSLPMDDQFLAYFNPRTGSISPLSLSDDEDDEDHVFPKFSCLCPKLEVFHCTDALFSDEGILEFLRSRSVDHRKHNVAHLRRVSVLFRPAGQLRFGDGGTGLKSQIERLREETGMMVHLQSFPCPSVPSIPPHMSPPPRYSPYDGISATEIPSSRGSGSLVYFGF